ncbi:MAG: phosphotransferase family protein [Acidobacteriota bacterium]|nr:phosphotransferase family protein [Acidobacteriota bacterium]
MTEEGIRLGSEIIEWIETVTATRVARADRIPGGGTREGWFIDVGPPAEPTAKLFLRYTPAQMPDKTAFHSLRTEAEVLRALKKTDVPVPRVIAVHPDREAVLMERIEGDTWFHRITDPAEQIRIAQGFIRSLAAQHRLDPRVLRIRGLGPVRSAREHALERIAALRERASRPDGRIDPILRITVDWLEANVPDYDGPVVLVQGDTGPGNFMYRHGAVAAVLDWELCHFGDPMDDIAWLSLRTVQDTFTRLPDRLSEYEQLSGHRIDEERVWYYRLFAEATMATLNPPHNDADGATRDIGNLMIYRQLHRRLWLEALNEVAGLGLERPSLSPTPTRHEWSDSYADMLASLRTVVPRVADPLAAQWIRGLARVVKYLEQADLSGREFVQDELSDIQELVEVPFSSIADARSRLDEAYLAGTVDQRRYIETVWNRVMREDELMRSASGALHDRTWPPLRSDDS